MKVIINGDDLGYTVANSLGIVEAYRNGILRSTTALMNSDHILEAKEMIKDLDGLGVGVHLTLTTGRPLTRNRTLSDENGFFFKGPDRIWDNHPDYDEIYNEFNAQILRFIDIFGKRPTHLDGHHSVHDKTKEVLEVTERLSREFDLPIRGHSAYTLISDFRGEDVSVDKLISILSSHKDEDIEIMCHPGYCDLELYRTSSYSLQRVKELDVLCDRRVIDHIRDQKIQLSHY